MCPCPWRRTGPRWRRPRAAPQRWRLPLRHRSSSGGAPASAARSASRVRAASQPDTAVSKRTLSGGDELVLVIPALCDPTPLPCIRILTKTVYDTADQWPGHANPGLFYILLPGPALHVWQRADYTPSTCASCAGDGIDASRLHGSSLDEVLDAGKDVAPAAASDPNPSVDEASGSAASVDGARCAPVSVHEEHDTAIPDWTGSPTVYLWCIISRASARSFARAFSSTSAANLYLPACR